MTSSLSEVNATVETRLQGSYFKRLFAFMGPAYLVSVGYMDPGNWATDLAGGSRYGYALVWVLLMSNLMALLLQSFSARLGIVRNRDLAQASREFYHPAINMFLYVLAEIAIAACDLAEVLGMAIGLQLLFGLPLNYGILICVLDTFLLLFLLNYGMRKMEAFILALVALIGGAFFIELLMAQPSLAAISTGFIPSLPDDEALYIAIGIIGATVMPHNLYLHSSLVQTRRIDRSSSGIKKAIKFNFIDSAIALNLAFFVNAAILILAGTVFYNNGLFEVAEIQDAYKLLSPMLGTKWASILFALALIAAGQSSTITGTLAGQIVMEGYLNLRIQPWIRRIITRTLAVVPALIVINIMGEGATGKMLIFSQVVLSLQLGFAIVPLIHFVSDANTMKEFAIKPLLKILGWTSAIIIIVLNIRLVVQQLTEWEESAGSMIWMVYSAYAIALLAFGVLAYITVKPFIVKLKEREPYIPHRDAGSMPKVLPSHYSRIAVALDFSKSDSKTVSHALSIGGKQAEYILIHSVETVGAMFFGKDTGDYESSSDNKILDTYIEHLSKQGYRVSKAIAYGNPKTEIPAAVKIYHADLLVLGSHGHKGIKDLIFGTTVDAVRHRVKVPVFVIQ
ncbi:MAG: Nramp family divalent metal transporter [Bacteroidetes bacterium]|nr:Nramp family divalent metal transporter [Bacteroidota bacterium]